ncbi:MAG TPA: hypothetical protein VHQ90_00820 [Thermoanaerobaculia bacterium]|nr:hypothetical protein [Thermoanaerobaculia bacterium]
MTPDPAEATAVGRVFGAESRRQLIDEYFADAGGVTASNAWKHVYRLLLWIDRTTGLAHCYESDKAQPGRPWYARSLAFHAWVAKALGTTPGGLGGEIDRLFTRGTEKLASLIAGIESRRAAAAAGQRQPYEGLGFPIPGEDAGLEALITQELSSWVPEQLPLEGVRQLAQKIRAYLTQENKRKNLVGEGFEDVIAAVIQRLPGDTVPEVRTRPPLQSLPGFRPPPAGEKPRKVDLALLGRSGSRILVSAKWSVRADREEQFVADFEAYARLEDAGSDFGFVLITNEFDAARLLAACEKRRQNALLFSEVVHVNPLGPATAYAGSKRGSAVRLRSHIQSGRLRALGDWLSALSA